MQAEILRSQLIEVKGSYDVWHDRLGHIREKRMKLPSTRQALPHLQGNS